MKIVASNSLTVSNVNDGTITHTAYSNSADGSDGFTTVYPNLNLLSLSSVKIGQYLNWSNGLDLLGNANRAVFDYIQVVPNQTYTLSSSWNGWYISVFGYSDKTSSAKYILTSGKMQPITGSGFSESKNVTFAVPSDCNYLRLHIGNDSINTSASVVKTVKAKIEQGSTATPYMQSASEVTTADWPSYIGQYTNFTQADSTNPSDYTWGPMRGDDGISPTVKINPDTSLTIFDAKGTITTPVLKGNDGTDGTSGIIVSSVAPTSPKNGQLWQDTSTTPQLVKKWTGSSWVIWEFYAQNLKSDSLETVSSKIGNIYNDFTLEDGTTGTLHIGNSEYRINSQVLKDNFLFKENIFFDPDGVNFTFEGDSTSNSGYGNYSKSGSDFYLQNNKMASYTVSGIRMSNEFAGYRIQIHDSTHKMNFVSENGQGFDFTGPVSFNGIPMNTISSVTVASVFGISFQLTRVGNMVTVNVPVQIVNFIDIGENKKANEVLPLGFRPKTGASFGVFRFANNIAYPVFTLAFLNSGEIRFTNTQNGYLSSSGSVSYFTDDAMPVT